MPNCSTKIDGNIALISIQNATKSTENLTGNIFPKQHRKPPVAPTPGNWIAESPRDPPGSGDRSGGAARSPQTLVEDRSLAR